MIIRKSPQEIDRMRSAGRLVGHTLSVVAAAAEPGVALLELDVLAEQTIRGVGAVPSFLGYHGFPATLCLSPNDVVVHGIPSGYVLRDGDILSIDCGAVVEGYHGDAAVTVPVGEVDEAAARLVATTERSMWAGIAQVRAGNRLSDIGHAVEQVARGPGYGVVREYVGHGIGTAMHEEPQVPNYARPGPRSSPSSTAPDRRTGSVPGPSEPVRRPGVPLRVTLLAGSWPWYLVRQPRLLPGALRCGVLALWSRRDAISFQRATRVRSRVAVLAVTN